MLCVLNKPQRPNGVWGVKEYFSVGFIPTEKEKKSASRHGCIFPRKKSHYVVGGTQSQTGRSGWRKKNNFFSTENRIWILKPSVCCHYTNLTILVLFIHITSRETLSYHCHEHCRCQDIATEVGFQCNKSAMLGEIIKERPCICSIWKEYGSGMRHGAT